MHDIINSIENERDYTFKNKTKLSKVSYIFIFISNHRITIFNLYRFVVM